jgi:hypothetical protein
MNASSMRKNDGRRRMIVSQVSLCTNLQIASILHMRRCRFHLLVVNAEIPSNKRFVGKLC